MNIKAVSSFALAGLFAASAIACAVEGVKAMRARDSWADAVHYSPDGEKPSNVKVVEPETAE